MDLCPILQKRVENQNHSGYCIFYITLFYKSKTTKTIVSSVTVVIAIYNMKTIAPHHQHYINSDSKPNKQLPGSGLCWVKWKELWCATKLNHRLCSQGTPKILGKQLYVYRNSMVKQHCGIQSFGEAFLATVSIHLSLLSYHYSLKRELLEFMATHYCFCDEYLLWVSPYVSSAIVRLFVHPLA